jgi:hypothetical protein
VRLIIAGRRHQFKDPRGFCLAFDGDGIDLTRFELRPDRLSRSFGNQNLRAIDTVASFQPRCEVRSIADYRIAASVIRTDV